MFSKDFLHGLFYLGYRSSVVVDPRFFVYFLSCTGFCFSYVISISSFYKFYGSFSWLFDFCGSDVVSIDSVFFRKFCDFIYYRFGINVSAFSSLSLEDLDYPIGSFTHISSFDSISVGSTFFREIQSRAGPRKGRFARGDPTLRNIFFKELYCSWANT